MRRFILLCFSIAALSAQQNRGYYRFPAIHGDTIVFTAEGDLWETTVSGGTARRLTTHPGEETHAAFSPDGQTIAYSADYEGPTEVYTMPASGGLPTRRTFDGARAVVAGWTPDGKILVRTYSYSGLPNAQLATIANDGEVAIVPLSQAAQGSYDAAGRVLFFTRFAAQPSQNKRYHGGTAENIWKYSEGHDAIPLTSGYTGASKNPMWWKNRVYFASDRDGTMNLWSMNEDGEDLRQHTKHQGFDVNSPAMSGGRIVYQLGADLRIYDARTGDSKTIPIDLASDFDHLRERWVKNPVEYLSSAHLSPDGNSVVLTARGRVFVAPAKEGRFVDATAHKPGRYRDARMMPDGKSLLLVSTESGETELWKYPANGAGVGEQLTKGATVLRWEGIPSPDGKWVAHQDKDQELWLLDLASKTEKPIAAITNGDNDGPTYGALHWSPDSRWITYSQNAANNFTQLALYSVATGATTLLTTDRYNSSSAAWSADGKWIYFLSDRALKSVVTNPWGVRQPDPYFDRSDKIYALPLTKGLVSPFQPMDELHPAKKPEEKKPDGGEPASVKVEIDLDGIAARIQEVPVAPGNYSGLTVAGSRLCWMNRDDAEPAKTALECVAMANNGGKPETLLDGVRDFQVSTDGTKMLIRKENELFVVDAASKADALKTPKTLDDSRVNLKTWTFSVIPADEFRELFLDAWRLHRDYFYDRKMHGIPWTTMRDKYVELIGRVRDRQELNDLIAGMVSELSALHTFVVGGDVRKGQDQVQVASLGALLVRAPSEGGYRIQHIYRTDPDRPDKLSPLLRPYAGVNEQDVLIAINGRDLATSSPGELLRDQAGKQVLITVRRKGETATRDSVVTPITMAQDADLRYSEWEYTRRMAVETTTDARLAYIHLRAMRSADINQWMEEYSPIHDRDGLIIDVRHNRGGNIDSWVLGKLMRKAWMYWQGRKGLPYWNMQEAFRGPMVVLCDEDTASDGEAFAEGFRRLGLGKIIGTRTWGGEIWLSFSNALADRGIASAAEKGVYGPERKWLIEGHGVEPDQVVDNLPHATFEGHDAQLDAAIAHLRRSIQERPNPVPAAPDYPDKSFKSGR